MIELLFALICALSIAAALKESTQDSVFIGWKGIIPYRLKLDKHILIIGPTRSGKSSLAKAIIERLKNKYLITVIDWHGEYNVENVPIIPFNKLKFNLEELPVKILVEVLGYGLNLNEPSIYMLYKILRNSKYSTVHELIKAIDEYLVTTRTEAEMKAAILRRIEYVFSNLGNGSLDISLLTKIDSIIDLSELSIIEEKKLAIAFILAYIYMYYTKHEVPCPGKIRHIILIDEVQDYATRWLWTYNHERPNMGLGGITPIQKLAMVA